MKPVVVQVGQNDDVSTMKWNGFVGHDAISIQHRLASQRLSAVEHSADGPPTQTSVRNRIAVEDIHQCGHCRIWQIPTRPLAIITHFTWVISHLI
ncbi:MAG: hypothetical protein ACRBB0_04425 [Pelagimonas sp.]|uniref:hypothetical protein n=1 Tax=Pelagimonas sp. TaxID=2073170 RepID=UPI003D6B5315